MPRNFERSQAKNNFGENQMTNNLDAHQEVEIFGENQKKASPINKDNNGRRQGAVRRKGITFGAVRKRNFGANQKRIFGENRKDRNFGESQKKRIFDESQLRSTRTEKHRVFLGHGDTHFSLRANAVDVSTPPLGTILDCAATAHVYTRVENREPCSVNLQGEHATKVITTKGTVGSLTDVLENVHSPGNLTSLMKLFEDGPWMYFTFFLTKVYGIRKNGTQDLIAIKNDTTHGLYKCTPIVTRKHFLADPDPMSRVVLPGGAHGRVRHRAPVKGGRRWSTCNAKLQVRWSPRKGWFGAHGRDMHQAPIKGGRRRKNRDGPLTGRLQGRWSPRKWVAREVNSGGVGNIRQQARAMVGSSTDTHELRHTDNILRRMGLPSPELVRIMIKNNTVKRFSVDEKCLRRYRKQSNESRLRGSQTVPRYIAVKKKMPIPRSKLVYLEHLYGDSKALTYPGPNGERWVFTMIDRATGTPWTFLHKDWTSLHLLLEKKIIEILEDARKNLGIASPKISVFHLDGHPTQIGRLGALTEMQVMLQRLKIFVPRLPPGDHARMGLVERLHQTLCRLATTIFHDQGHGLGEEFFSYAYLHATKVKDTWPQTGRVGTPSSFELRTGRPPLEDDLPYPALFSTAYIKDMDSVGLQGKKGFDHIGVVVDTGANAPAQRQMMKVYIPKTGEMKWRSGVAVNEAFSTFGADRIQRMRDGRAVHRHTDMSTRVHTRATVHSASRVTSTVLPVPGSPDVSYLLAKRHGVPIARPILCSDVNCKHNHEDHGFRNVRGYKIHLASKARKFLRTQQNRVEDENKRIAEAAKTNKDKSAKELLDLQMRDKWVSPRRQKEKALQALIKTRERQRQSKQHRALFTQTLEEYATRREKSRMVERTATERKVKPWLEKEKWRLKATRRKQDRVEAMRNALHPKPEQTKTMNDYVVSAAESEIMNMYDSLLYTKDNAPAYSADNDFVTFRALLVRYGNKQMGDGNNMTDLLENDDDMLFYQRDPCELGTPLHEDYAEKCFPAVTGRSKPTLTEENAIRLTPMNHRELIQSPYYKEWMEAMQNEINVLNDYNVFKFVKLDGSFKRITLRWIYKIKFRNGKFEKFKARLVARGYTQRPGLDYDPNGISAPVARASTIKAVLSEGTAKKWYFGEFDVKSAYLLAELSEDVFAALPYGVKPVGDTNSLKLCKSLYGLRQAGFNWNTKFTGILVGLGFIQSKVDPCLYNYNHGGHIIRVALWVDDGLVSTNDEAKWKDIQKKLHAITPLGHMGDLEWLLGMHISYNREKGILRLSQREKIKVLLERYGMGRCNPTSLPMPNGTQLSADGPTTSEEKKIVAAVAGKSSAGHVHTYEDLVRFCREVIGSIGYLACWGRPDVRHAVYYLARYQANPSLKIYQLVKHLMRYLQGTQDLSLTFGTRHYDNESPLVCMVDSNYIGDGDSCYSTTGYVFFYYGSPILCESKKQTAVSTSTTEAELIAASHAVRTGIYLRKLLISDFGLDPNMLTLVGEDNQGCIGISRGGGSHARLRHVRVADSYIYQEVRVNNTHSMRYVRSRDNVSDIFTKAADPETFKRLRWYLMGDAPNDEHSEMTRHQHVRYHWIAENFVDAPAEECWRMCVEQ